MYGPTTSPTLEVNFGDHPSILSHTGVAQGDNLSPFLFALGIAPILNEVGDRDFLTLLSWLDDITLIGSAAKVQQALIDIKNKFAVAGLELNMDKCFIFWKSHVSEENKQQFPDLSTLQEIPSEKGFRLLGIPFGSLEYQTNFLDKLLEKLKHELTAIGQLESHTEKFLLLYYCWTRKPQYLLRVLPPAITDPFVAKLNKFLFAQLSTWWDLPVSPENDTNGISEEDSNALPEASQKQLPLPIRRGGMGLGINPKLTGPSYFCGQLAALDLHESLLPSTMKAQELVKLEEYYQQYKQLPNFPDSSVLSDLVGLNHLQKTLSDIIHKQTLDDLMSDPAHHTRLHSLTEFYGAGNWLLGHPGDWLVTLKDREWLDAVSLRLDLPRHTEEEHIDCPECNTGMDATQSHRLLCRHLKKHRNARHNLVKHELSKIFSAAGLSYEEEPYYTREADAHGRPNNNKQAIRPDQLVFDFGIQSQTKILATDVKIFFPSDTNQMTREENGKRKTYCYANGKNKIACNPHRGRGMIKASDIRFEPLIANVYGGWNERMAKVIREAAFICTQKSGRYTHAATFRHYAWLKLSMAVQKGNSISHEHFDKLLNSTRGKATRALVPGSHLMTENFDQGRRALLV